MKSTTNLIIVSVVCLFIGFIAGAFINMSSHMSKTDGHSHNLPHSHHNMHHGSMEVSGDIPTVDLIVTEDPMSGWNLQIITENFVFSPEDASQDHVEGEGHAHLYIDGNKITRLYSEWYHIPELTPGNHDIEVTLNSNNHRDLTVSDEKIADSETITVIAR